MTRLPNEINLGKIFEMAVLFRRAIEICEPRYLTISLQDFPKGSCGDASLLLGTFFLDENMGPFEYILGERRVGDDFESHAWISSGNTMVDITADQFPDNPPIIVGKTSYWHQTFEIESRGIADYRRYDPLTVAKIEMSYHAIRQIISNAQH